MNRNKPNSNSKARATVNARTQREAMRSGIVLRAQTFTDRRKDADRKACRDFDRTEAWS